MSYKSPIEDFKYNLAMLNYDEVIAGIEKFKEYDSETLMSVVSEIGRLNEQEVLDSNKIGDREGLKYVTCLLYTSPSPRDRLLSRMPSSA